MFKPAIGSSGRLLIMWDPMVFHVFGSFDGSSFIGVVGYINRFMLDARLIDSPLVVRKYTWYCPDESAMSQLDRFLVSVEWLNDWHTYLSGICNAQFQIIV